MKGYYVSGVNGEVVILEDGRYADTFVEESSEKWDPAIIYEQLKAEITDRVNEPLSGEWNATDLEICVWVQEQKPRIE